tara:strand:+ start:13811 stop:14362 length:552 start_codon:yes stop_codon:yes gene_type:complete
MGMAVIMLAACVHDDVEMTGTAIAEEAVEDAGPETPTVYYAMTDIYQPQFQGYADTAFWVWNDEGELDASGLTEEQWETMLVSAKNLRDISLQFSEEPDIRVAEPGEQLFNEGKGFIPSESVQAVIDTNPDGFRAMMAYMAEQSDLAVQAVEARNAQGVSDASDNIYAACKSCHTAFWYPGRR